MERKVEKEIKKRLYNNEIISIIGIKGIGKTTMMLHLQKEFRTENTAFISFKDTSFRILGEDGGASLIRFLRQREGLQPSERFFLFLDDISFLSSPCKLLKFISGRYPHIKLIFSSERSLFCGQKTDEITPTRFVTFFLHPLDFEEFIELKRGKWPERYEMQRLTTHREIKALFTEYIRFGAIPSVVEVDSIPLKEEFLRSIIQATIYTDAVQHYNIKDSVKLYRFIRHLAQRNGQLLNTTELAAVTEIAKQSAQKYLRFLEEYNIIRLIKPYHKKGSSELTKTPVIYFSDSGLSNILKNDFLSSKISDDAFKTVILNHFIRHYSLDSVYHWRTQDKKSIDFIIRKRGKIVPFCVSVHAALKKPSILRYFDALYQIKKAVCISLEGNAKEGFPSQTLFVKPWELKDIKTL